jgi:uncharacterized membrane protein SirB2
MISYYSYKFLHICAVVLVLLSIGASLFQTKNKEWREKRLMSILNGVGLVIMLVAGFGLLARLAVSWPWQGWIFVKLIAWIGLGSTHFLSTRFPDCGKGFWWLSALLAIVATSMAIYKPF